MTNILSFIYAILISTLLSCGDEQTGSAKKQTLHDTFSAQTAKDSNNISATEDTSESKEIQINYSQTADTFSQSIKLSSQIQKFRITGTADTTIFGKEGTRVFIPSYCFVTAEGKSVTGRVDIEIKECYKIGEIIKEKLSTVCNNEILETAGMVYIEAKSNNKKLKLKNGEGLVIHFPKNNQSKEMNIFYGVQDKDGNTNWKIDSESLIKYKLFGYFSSFIPKRRDYKAGEKGSNDFKLFDLESYIEKSSDFSEKELNSFFENNDSAYIAIKFDQAHKPEIDIKHSPSPNFSEKLKKLCVDFIDDFNNKNKKWETTYTYEMKFRAVLGANKFKTNEAYKESFKKKYTNANIKDINNAELNYYIFNATELGWINCDRFYKSNERKIDFIVQTGQDFKGHLSIVFKNIKSIMTGTRVNNSFVFKNIPTNSVISVVAIKQTDNKSFLAVQQTTATETPFSALAFKTINLATLDKELEKIYQ